MQKISPLPAAASLAGRIPVRLLTAIFALCAAPLLSASTVQMAFEDGGNVQAFNYYVGPYRGEMNGNPVNLFCVDFRNEASAGLQWYADVSFVVDGADLSLTRFGARADAPALYQEAAWLTRQYFQQPAGEFGNIQATIWQLFDSSAPSPASSYWADQAAAHYREGDYADFRIITNLPPVEQYGQIQEFLMVEPSGVSAMNMVPEPATYLLIGLGLLGLAGAKRYRRG